MAFSLSFKVDSSIIVPQQLSLGFKSYSGEPQLKSGRGSFSLHGDWSSIKGSRLIITRPKHATSLLRRKGPAVRASWVSSSEIASSAFTLGTVAVLPFYTLMIVAPKAKLTKMSMGSSMPYMVLGLVYAYLLYLSWTPATVKAMFASKYLLPELSGIANLFSNEMTLTSAWIHLLGIDLFAARQIFHDGLENGIETRHSVSLCLLSCPVGILSHFITKALTKSSSNNEHDM